MWPVSFSKSDTVAGMANSMHRWPYLDAEVPFGMAHRGGRGVAPENTVAAFARAVQLGFRYLETDVHCTADGRLVAFHDADLGRVSGVAGRIDALRWDEIAEIELPGGHRIPLLDELLDTFPESRFNIDPKSDRAVDPLIDVIRRRHLYDRIGVGSFSDARIARLQRAVGPALCTSPGPRGVAMVLALAVIGWRRAVPYGCLQLPTPAFGLRLSAPWLVERIHRLGLQVHFWTINDPLEMERLLDAGADGIISDEVESLRDVLVARGHRAG